ncbi:MAG: hypothetical protein JRN68_04890 [Nitrososphaerota archaeon]|nr:hypothetical protein [Nitrososphaerota archaeon]
MRTAKLTRLAMVLSFAILPFPALSTLLTTLAAWIFAKKWTVPVFFLSLKWDLVRLPGYIALLTSYFRGAINLAISRGTSPSAAVGGIAGIVTIVDFLFMAGIYFALRFFEGEIRKRVR